MLGSISDSEDVLQESYLKWSSTRLGPVDNPEAFLTSIVSRLCIDKLRKRKIEKLNYTGPWLPEPVPTDEDPADKIASHESISMAFMVMLEYLSPLERAVFILREAFDLSHNNIAEQLQISPCHSRQLARRARLRVDVDTTPVTNAEAKPLVAAFYAALESGETEGLHQLLCEDVTAYTDGGGRVSAAMIPLRGQQTVIQVFSHLARKNAQDISASWSSINGQVGLVFREKKTNDINSIITFALTGQKISRIFVMRNPEKLKAFNGQVESAGSEFIRAIRLRGQ